MTQTLDGAAGSVFARATPAPGVVSFRASVTTAPDFAQGGDLVQELTVRLLDRGTTHRDRFAFAGALEGQGASLSFNADGLRAGFSGRCLREDLPLVLGLAAEALAAPAFDAEEVAKARARLDAGLRSAEEDAGAMGDGALRRALYTPGDVRYSEPFPDARDRLAAVGPADVTGFHAAHLAAAPLTLVLAGDTAGLPLSDLLGLFGDRTMVTAAAALPVAPDRSAERIRVLVPGKASFDVRFGQRVSLLRTDPEYLALRLGLFILGGNFSSRLMQTVRDRDGLTYGIHAGLRDAEQGHSGHAEIHVTLSPDHLERGIDVTRHELVRWHAEGVSEAELAVATETVAGGHAVGLSTSGGMASGLLSALEDGLGAGYVDDVPARVRALDAAAVNRALRAHLDPEAVVVVVAGSEAGETGV